MKNLEARLFTLEQTIERARPSGMIVTLADGRQVVTDGGGAVDLVRQGKAAKVESNQPGNGYLAELLTALCTN